MDLTSREISVYLNAWGKPKKTLKVNWNAETSWPLSRDFEALKTVSKEFLKNSFSFSRYQLLKSKNSAGQILGFHRFPKKYCRAISVFDVTDDLCSYFESDLMFIQNQGVCFQGAGPPESQFCRFLRNIS